MGWPLVAAAAGAAVSLYGSSKQKSPKFQYNPFIKDPKYQQRLGQAENSYTRNLQSYLDRAPGFDEADKQAMYKMPAEQSKQGETEALRQLNRGSAFAGNYSGNQRIAGKASILGQGIALRANMQRQTRLDAARAALADRIQQLQAAAGYTDSRLGFLADEYASVNNWKRDTWKDKNAQSAGKWGAMGSAISSFGGMGGGGGGMGGMMGGAV